MSFDVLFMTAIDAIITSSSFKPINVMAEPFDGDISSVVNGISFGYVVSAVLLGITILQGWIYFHNNHDKWTIRTFIAVLITLDIAETCCSTQIIHYYLISIRKKSHESVAVHSLDRGRKLLSIHFTLSKLYVISTRL
ncbi:hypothetical protein FPV67DRAFT_990519 [Lyophyllum atratum]|nr:hypothetical protein FPV67DRAFT_990519 [Lyophyllum atratum]